MHSAAIFKQAIRGDVDDEYGDYDDEDDRCIMMTMRMIIVIITIRMSRTMMMQL